MSFFHKKTTYEIVYRDYAGYPKKSRKYTSKDAAKRAVDKYNKKGYQVVNIVMSERCPPNYKYL